MQRTVRVAERVAASDVPLLITGESGREGGLRARCPRREARAARAFVSENCAIPEPLLESALFGHVRGAFTGADRTRVGLFEAADGGTLFLDEIGEMGPAMQTKLLRILEDGIVRPLGTNATRSVDVRVIAATNRPLAQMVDQKTFREDLYYRLNVVTLAVPPLRDRREDIAPLVAHFIEKHTHRRRVKITKRAMDVLESGPWPGNVRQLENVVRRALVLADVIDREHVAPWDEQAKADLSLDVRRRVADLETELVREALARTGHNQSRAAKLLGLSRFGLQKMMKRLNVS